MNIIRNNWILFVLLTTISLSAEKRNWQTDPAYVKAHAWLDLSDSEQNSNEVITEVVESVNLEKQNSAPAHQKRTDESIVLPVLEKIFKSARQLFRSDPLSVSRKSTDSQGRTSVFNPVRFRLIKFDGFERTISNTTSYARDLGQQRSASISLNFVPLQLDGDFGDFKMKAWDLSAGFRKYFGEKYFFQTNLGVRKYQPNWAYRQYYEERNQKFGDKSLPYLHLEVGRQLLKEVPIVKRPLVLTAAYNWSDDLEYPSADPHGYRKIDLSGFSLKVSVSFKI